MDGGPARLHVTIVVRRSSGAFLAVYVSALEQGGPGLAATLIIVSSLFQFVLAARLSAPRGIFTPTVAGTVLMLIPITLASVILGQLADVPEGASPVAAPVTAGVTLLAIIVTRSELAACGGYGDRSSP